MQDDGGLTARAERRWLQQQLKALRAGHSSRQARRFAAGLFTPEEVGLLLALELGRAEEWAARLAEQLLQAAYREEIRLRDPETELLQGEHTSRQGNGVLKRGDVNDWLERQGASYRWADPAPAAVVAAPSPVVTLSADEIKSQRQARRYQACVDAGLILPSDDYGAMPRGIGKVAERLGITRQTLTADVKAHIRRLGGA